MSRHQFVSSLERAIFCRRGSAGLDLGGLNLSGLNLTAVGPSAVAAPSAVLYTPPESRPIAEGLQGIFQLGKSIERVDPIKDVSDRSDFPAISGLLKENSSTEARLWRNDALQKLEQFWNPVYHPTTESNEMIRSGTPEVVGQGYWVVPLFGLWKTAPTAAARDELGRFLATATSYLLPFGDRPPAYDVGVVTSPVVWTGGSYAIGGYVEKARKKGINPGWMTPYIQPSSWACAGWPGLRGDEWIAVWDALRTYPVYGGDSGMEYQLRKMMGNWMSRAVSGIRNRKTILGFMPDCAIPAGIKFEV